ncbi:MAG TPA: S4 domain-containing protein [Gammaproteobacteria bacterium]|nr:S4 domain-containing protein [Gammaproteobacteria bacterium]
MNDETSRVRIDKWLWAARFFKTRALAQAAVSGGKVHRDGERVKPSYAVREGDRLTITRGEERFEVVVRGISDVRGPASVAQQLYEETEASRARREEAREVRRLLRQSAPRPEHKPDKRSRRHIIRFKGQ